MKAMLIVVLALCVGCINLAVSEQVCSSFCSSIGMLQENLVQIFTKSTRLPEECPVATGSTLLLVYTRFIVTWN